MPRRRWSFWMPPQDHVGLRWATLRYRAWLTPSGRTVLWGALAATVMSSAGTIIVSYLVVSLALGLLLAAWLLAALQRPRLEVWRELPAPPSAGQTARYGVRIRNRGRKSVRALCVLEAELPYGLYLPPDREGGSGLLEQLPPGAEGRVELAVQCSQRGLYELTRLSAGTERPSGLVRWPRKIPVSNRLVVYPRFVPQTEFELPVGRRYQPGGIAISSSVGDSVEFLGTREYREGDRLRDIHWASYARTGRLVVREWLEEYFVRIGVILDTQVPRADSGDAFERRISLAAGIADALARRDYVIDLFAAGAQIHHFQAGRALVRLESLLELLACVEDTRQVDIATVESAVAEHAQRLSSVVVLLSDWDAPRARLCKTLRESGAGVRPIVVREGPTSLPPEPDVLCLPARGGEERLR